MIVSIFGLGASRSTVATEMSWMSRTFTRSKSAFTFPAAGSASSDVRALEARPHERLLHHGRQDGRAVHVDAVDLRVVGAQVAAIVQAEGAPGTSAGVRLDRMALRLCDGLHASLDA